MSKGILIVVSGFSGAGKGTITKELVKRYENYCLSVSATSRKPREGEVEGRDYFYKTREEFESMIENDELLEHAQYVGNYYGTPKKYVEDCINAGRDVILEIEVQGALQIKKKVPEAVTIFMTTPTIAILKQRLIGRGTETLEVIEQRLKRAKEEAEYMTQYDYIIVNDDLEECVTGLNDLLASLHSRVSNNEEFISSIKKQLQEI
ncbi:MAG: guanylate kinase [Lachnospiraceae bacterium]|nr:guanylate kinase [Lachnospiraceae bacterium]